MTGPTPAPVTLAGLVWHWGSAYAIGYRDDQWTATRRDGRGVLTRPTLAALETVIEADYRTDPVSRAFDPIGTPQGHEDADDDRPGADESFLLAALAEAFPAWVISYDSTARTWTARTGKKTICEPTAVLLCAALVMAERRSRPLAGGR